MRHYTPERFLDDDRLLINVSVWESSTLAFYSLSTQMIQEMDGAIGLVRLNLLDDGRYLVYSPTRVGAGIDAFLIGTPSDKALVPFELNSILVDDFAAQGLVSVTIDNAVEIESGHILFVGTGMPNVGEPGFQSFVGEYDFNTGELLVTLKEPNPEMDAWLGNLSPDGLYRAGLSNIKWVDWGMEGGLVIADVTTDAFVPLPLLPAVTDFQWAQK